MIVNSKLLTPGGKKLSGRHFFPVQTGEKNGEMVLEIAFATCNTLKKQDKNSDSDIVGDYGTPFA